MPVVRENEDEGETEKLHFYKPAPKHAAPEVNVKDTAEEDSLKPSCLNGRKRQRQSGDSKTCFSPPGKRFSSSALTPEDIDLLDSYWETLVGKWRKKRLVLSALLGFGLHLKIRQFPCHVQRCIEMWMELLVLLWIIRYFFSPLMNY